MKITGAAGFALAFALFSTNAVAERVSATEIQNALLGASSETKTVGADIEISITLPDWPKVEPIVFARELEITYSKNGDSIMIMTDQLGPFETSLESIPENFKPVTLELKLTNSAIKVGRDADNNVTVSSVDIDVSAFKSKEKIAAFAIKGISFDTVDESGNSAYLEFSATLPNAGHELFDQFLAGKRIKGEVIINFSLPPSK